MVGHLSRVALSRCFRGGAIALCLLLGLLPSVSRGEPLTSLSESGLFGARKDLVREPGQKNLAWQFRLEIPEGADNGGASWIRKFRTTGQLIVLEEAFGHDAYFVRVKLQGKTDKQRRGTLFVWVRRSEQAAPERRPVAPRLGFSANPLQPEFRCEDPQETLAYSLYDRNSGDLLVQEVLAGSDSFRVAGPPLEVGGRYLLVATQSDAWGRYSMARNLAFMIAREQISCPVCDGDGIAWNPGESGPPAPALPVCQRCQGSGAVWVEVFTRERLPGS